MEIYNGTDFAGTSANFPYPIKLEYEIGNHSDLDSGYAYLTPLRIPDYPLCGYPISVDTCQTLSDLHSAGLLQLCLEVETTRASHKQGRKGKKRQEKHPCRGGKFSVPNGVISYCVENFNIEETYTFPIVVPYNLGSLFSKTGQRNIFFNIRGTYRMMIVGGTPIGVRTGIYSNTAKVVFSK